MKAPTPSVLITRVRLYPSTMMPGGMVFLRFGADHHGLALVGGTAAAIAVVAVLTNTPTTVGVAQQ